MEVYLDNSATTRCFDEVAQLMTKVMCEDYGNPSSLHRKGVQAEQYIRLFCKKADIARQYVNRWLPIVAAAQLTKKKEQEKEILMRWIDVIEYQ